MRRVVAALRRRHLTREPVLELVDETGFFLPLTRNEGAGCGVYNLPNRQNATRIIPSTYKT